jgi:hypothetical protein
MASKTKVIYADKRFVTPVDHTATSSLTARLTEYKLTHDKNGEEKTSYEIYRDIKMSDCNRFINWDISCDSKEDLEILRYRLKETIDFFQKISDFIETHDLSLLPNKERDD